MVTNLLDPPIFTVCLPFLAKEVYDSSVALGLMAAASAVARCWAPSSTGRSDGEYPGGPS